MNHEWVLLWFPIILATGVGGRLLGRPRAVGLGVLCALFWMVLIQARQGASVWMHGWSIASIVSGALAIAGMALWASESAPWVSTAPAASGSKAAVVSGRTGRDGDGFSRFSRCLEQFDEWLESRRTDPDPWPEFGEFIRGVLYDCCATSHVRLFRVLSEDEELVPVREAHPFTEDEWPSAREGIVGHVVTTGRSYLAGDASQGELIENLARRTPKAPVWCFAVTQGARKIGVVTVGGLEGHERFDRNHYRAVELLVAHFWNTLSEVCRGRTAETRDPTSNALTRKSFFSEAERALGESYKQGEPCALAVVAMESLRHLNDTGRWDTFDEVVREVSWTLTQRMRGDDLLGRFDESRFLLLLRRVDSSLGSLILQQITAKLAALCSDEHRWDTELAVRCGVAGTGTGRAAFGTLLSQALSLCREAREGGVVLASDLQPDEACSV